ncbi:MAG: hypothetical protein AAGA03_19570, partial [Planctomycetota bacterium]
MATVVGPNGIRFCSRRLLACVAILLLLLAVLMTGCTPRVIVRPNPGPTDQGIRYYRPKPYLKVEPAEIAVDRRKSLPFRRNSRAKLRAGTS